MNARTPGLGAGTLVLRATLLTLVALTTAGIGPGVARGGPPPEIDPMARPVAALALDLFRETGVTGENLCFSPLSISTALAMAYAGASGETEAEMARTLHFSQGRDTHGYFSLLLTKLNATGERGAGEVVVANRLWGQKGYQFYERFLEELRVNYGAALAEVDFRNHTEDARLAINAWVEEKTRERIKNIVPPGALSPLASLVLVNAIYFKAEWMDHFTESMTTEEPFWLTANESAPAPMMHRIGSYGYLETDDAQVLELPYKRGVYSMLVYLPKERDGLAELEHRLTVDGLIEDVQDLPRRRVHLSLPRFEITSSFSLGEALVRLGMRTAFVADKADFTRMSLNPDLYISDVLHKAFVKADENGTEAAAATAVIMATEGAIVEMAPPLEFLADHPFLFVIRYRSTGSILFMGRVSDPSV